MRLWFLKIPVYLLFSVLLAKGVCADVIGISPGSLYFDNMLKGGYAERTVLVSSNSHEILKGHIEISDEIKNWVKFEPDSLNFNVSAKNPYSLKVIAAPPEDARNGIYTGTIKFVSDGIANFTEGSGSKILAAVILRVSIEVTGNQLLKCNVGGIGIRSAEIDYPLELSYVFENEGNVRMYPKVKIDILDQSQKNLIHSQVLQAEYVLPTLKKSISQNFFYNLSPGQYFAYVTFEDCQVSKLTSFDVVGKGEISDSGSLIGIKANKYVYVKENTQLVAVFVNSGPRFVYASFKGEIRDVNTDKIVKVIQSDKILVEKDKSIEFQDYFTPENPGQYVASGYVVYNNKITFKETSPVITAIENKENEGWQKYSLIAFVYAAVLITVIFLITKIKKKKNR